MESLIDVTEDSPGLAIFRFPNGCRLIVGATQTDLTIETQDEKGQAIHPIKVIPLVLLA